MLGKNFSWLPHDPKVLEAISLIFGADYLTLERPQNEEVYKQSILSGKDFKEILNFTGNGEHIEPIKHKGNDCFAVYGNNRRRIVEIYCLHLNIEKSLLNLYKEHEMEKHAQQVLALLDTQIAILLEDLIEIWSTADEFKLHQMLKTISKPTQIATGQIDGTNYLAVVTTTNSCSNLLCPTIEIYNSNLHVYQHQQTLELPGEPQQIAFSYLKSIKDLFLFVRIGTDQSGIEIMIYQLKGIMGFQLVAGPKTLLKSESFNMQIIEMKATNKNCLVLFAGGTVSFVDFKFKIF